MTDPLRRARQDMQRTRDAAKRARRRDMTLGRIPDAPGGQAERAKRRKRDKAARAARKKNR
jgi:hypothetical protein